MKFAIPIILIASVVVIFTLTQRNSSVQNSHQQTNDQTGQVMNNNSEQDPEQEESTPIENEVERSEIVSFAQCLANSGVVIYVSKTCPACKDLVNKLGGYDVADGLFVECGQDPVLCRANMQTKYVPEIQINGEVVEFQNRIDGLSKETGCILP